MILDFVRCREDEASRFLPRMPHVLRVFLVHVDRAKAHPDGPNGHPFDVSGGVRPGAA